jgi:hypothetical protein
MSESNNALERTCALVGRFQYHFGRLERKIDGSRAEPEVAPRSASRTRPRCCQGTVRAIACSFFITWSLSEIGGIVCGGSAV